MKLVACPWLSALLALLCCTSARAQSDPLAVQEPAWRAELPVEVELDQDAQNAVAGINEFSMELYLGTIDPAKNHFISPASVSTAMSLAYRASGGTTAEELRQHLHYSASPEAYLRAARGVLESMNFKRSGRELATANSIWIDKSVVLSPDYVADTTGLAGSSIEQADFRGAPEPARVKINDWISDNTHGRITDLIPENAIDETTRSVLVNTIYWKADWQAPFSKSLTKQEPFHKLDGGKIDLDLMHQESSFQALERGGVKAILLPYRGNELQMAVFLPNSRKGLPQLEARLTSRSLEEWFAELGAAKQHRTELTLPKMHLVWRGELVPVFRSMGMQAPFGSQADFKAIAAEGDQDATLTIGSIIHEAYLDVDEEGSEAAGATAVGIITSGSRRPAEQEPPFVFKADHPFFFVLRDRRTGLICFMGRYLGPGGAD